MPSRQASSETIYLECGILVSRGKRQVANGKHKATKPYYLGHILFRKLLCIHTTIWNSEICWLWGANSNRETADFAHGMQEIANACSRVVIVCRFFSLQIMQSWHGILYYVTRHIHFAPEGVSMKHWPVNDQIDWSLHGMIRTGSHMFRLGPPQKSCFRESPYANQRHYCMFYSVNCDDQWSWFNNSELWYWFLMILVFSFHNYYEG